MYNGFYSDPYSRESDEDGEIYMKNGQFYDNETRSTVPIKKDTAPYDDLPESVQQSLNAGCRCGTTKTRLINEPQHTDKPDCKGSASKFSNMTNPQSGGSESSKITLNISLTIMEIIEILVLIMIVVLIAIAIRTRSRVLIFAAPTTQQSNPANPTVQ
jgi:hypothetical protein